MLTDLAIRPRRMGTAAHGRAVEPRSQLQHLATQRTCSLDQSTERGQRLRLYVCYISGADGTMGRNHRDTFWRVIGPHPGRSREDLGHRRSRLHRLERGHREAVPDGARLAIADLRDLLAVEGVAREGFDGVLHFAALALVGESVAHPERYYRTKRRRNPQPSRRDARSRHTATGVLIDVRRLWTARHGSHRRDCATRPANAYGASKLAVDRMISDECLAHGLGAVSLRYFDVAGAHAGLGEDHEPDTHLIPNVLRAAQGLHPYVEVFGTDYPTPDGTAIRDYIHIDDLSRAHLLALEGQRPGEHQIFNLGNGSGFSVREVIAAARAVTGAEIPVRESDRRSGDPPMLVAASERIRSGLGWEPQKPELERIVADAWAFMQAHPSGYSE